MHDPPHTPRIRHEQCREGLCGTQNRAKICPGTHSGSPVVPKSVPGASREHLGSAPGRPWRAPGAPGGSSNYLGRGMARVYPFYSIFIDLDCENRYDRDFVASTLTFWRRLAPECESGCDFLTIIRVFIFQTTILAPKGARLYPGSTTALPRP